MKLFIVFSLIFIFSYNSSLIGCEVCGCGAGATYFGLQPNLARNFVGIRWRTMDFDSHLGVANVFVPKKYSTQQNYSHVGILLINCKH